MKKALLIILASAMALSFLAGCGNSNNQNQQSGGSEGGVKNPGIVVIASDSEPTLLDPHIAYDPMSSNAILQTYETLVVYEGETSEIVPFLAKDWEITEEGKVWTFYLRDDVNFSDGTPFNAEAVKVNFERILDINQGPAWIFDMVVDVEAVDEFTARFTLEYPYASFLHGLASGNGGVFISPKAIHDNAVDGDWAQAWLRDNMVGTGPYMLESWVIGQGWSMVQNPGYWRGWEGEHVEKIELRVIKESASRMLMLENGDADFAENITRDTLDQLFDNPDVVVLQKPSINVLNICFNNTRGALQDKLVRQAMSYAFSYDDAVFGIYTGRASYQTGAMANGVWGFNPSLERYETNLEKAKELLEQAGYPGGGGLRFTCQTETGADDYGKVVELFQSDMAKIGITIDIQVLSWATIADMLQTPEGAADMFITGVYPDFPDPDNALYAQFHTSGIGNINQSFYMNEEVDKLLDQARRTIDDTEREALYYEIQTIVNEDAPCLFVLVRDMMQTYRAWVNGYVYNPFVTRTYYPISK
ncbi:MAG: ABC transporter substrate-binding protein [Eubacteriaceae bacterium]|nr:ABC transporter substrate-binding protein [Eubacteriaceae bacterium]